MLNLYKISARYVKFDKATAKTEETTLCVDSVCILIKLSCKANAAWKSA